MHSSGCVTISEIEVEVKKLIDRVRDIRAEQNYQRVCVMYYSIQL